VEVVSDLLPEPTSGSASAAIARDEKEQMNAEHQALAARLQLAQEILEQSQLRE
jgi:hypothetical protein